MRLTLKKAKLAYRESISKPNHLDVIIDGVDIEDLLIHVDIGTAIDYYGVTELLDTIGELYLNPDLAHLKHAERRSDKV